MLDERQQVAASAFRGMTLVVGGPGTGKTITLVEAVAARVTQGDPLQEIAVLAGSRTAAQQLRRDVIGHVGRAQTQPLFTTVHGLALGLLRLNQTSDEDAWAVLRAPEQEERIRDLLQAHRATWPQSLQPALGTRGFARQLREVLARIRQRSWDEHDVAALARERGDAQLAAIARFLDEYLAIGDLAQTIDYAELVYRARLLLHDPTFGATVRQRIREVFVDDAHDLDPAQIALLRDLATLGIPVTVFGDPDQVVSEFRGATVRGLFEALDVTPSRVVTLEESHRHSEAVAAALHAVRRHIAAIGPRPTYAARHDAAGEVTITMYDSVSAEIAHVVNQLRHAVAQGAHWSDLAVIVRAGRTQLMPVTRALLSFGIPVEVAAEELVLSEDEAVGTLLTALRLAASGEPPADAEARALLSSQLVGLDPVAIRRLERSTDDESVWETVTTADPEGEWGVARTVADTLAEVASGLASGVSVPEALWKLWACTSWPERLRREALDGQRQANHQLDAVVELFERASKQPILSGVAGALAFIRQLTEQEIPADTGRESRLTGTGVLVTTAHRAKGRQWPQVWVLGVQEGRWPKAAPGGQLLDPGRLLDAQPRTIAEHLQEERRLFYLACSRARTHLHVSAVADNDLQPSRFLRELGVTPTTVLGHPEHPLTSAALVGALRAAAADPQASEVLRAGAALRLRRLGAKGVTAADPVHWWCATNHEQLAPARTPIWLSGSALESILECPRRYFLSRRAHAASASNWTASFGTLIHRIAQQAQAERLGVEDMHALVAEGWDEVEFPAPWQEAAEREAADGIIDRLARWFPERQDTLLAVEHSFETQVEVAGTTVVLHGTVDRLELIEGDDGPKLRIVDFKTMRRKPTAKDVAENVQLGLYQLAAAAGAFESLAPGVRQVAASALLLLRLDSSGLPTVMEQAPLTAAPTLKDEALTVGPTWMHDRIASAVTVLGSGEFPATRGDACTHCDFQAGCPAWQEA